MPSIYWAFVLAGAAFAVIPADADIVNAAIELI